MSEDSFHIESGRPQASAVTWLRNTFCARPDSAPRLLAPLFPTHFAGIMGSTQVQRVKNFQLPVYK
jgi:hypothetical protein